MPHSHSPPSAADDFTVGYCTNVHAGKELAEVIRNVTQYCEPVRRRLRDSRWLGIGLWFAESAAELAVQGNQLEVLADLMRRSQLIPFTLNGFPQGDFHQEIVKHRVYQPTWWEPERLRYTQNLVRILSALLPSGQTGTISTLPIAWGTPAPSQHQLRMAASHLAQLAVELERRFQETGQRILIAIEPEPGCCLTDTRSLRQFFRDYLSLPTFSSRECESIRNHIGICHDVCHAAVMFEEQAAEFRSLKEEGIAIAKVQVSSAIAVDWDRWTIEEQQQVVAQLRGFAEDRYLHQTNMRSDLHEPARLVEDLPIALRNLVPDERMRGVWNIHFHLPIFLESFGYLRSTQSEIRTCVELLSRGTDVPEFTGHYEIETYAWGVLPESLQESDLVTCIAREVEWFRALLGEQFRIQ